VAEVREDKKRGLVARLTRSAEVDAGKVREVLGAFTIPWDLD
jgi:fatty-acyl-CoA synthase